MDVSKLVKKAKRGNKKALLDLILNQKDDYYRLAFSYMKTQNDSLDVLEEMIIILYEKIQQLKNADSFYSWSKTILVNCCKSHLKKQQKELLIGDKLDTHLDGIRHDHTTDPYYNSDQKLDINQLLLKINPDQADAIRLKYLFDFNYETISNITGVSVGTVKSRIYQGLKKLKSICGGHEQ